MSEPFDSKNTEDILKRLQKPTWEVKGEPMSKREGGKNPAEGKEGEMYICPKAGECPEFAGKEEGYKCKYGYPHERSKHNVCYMGGDLCPSYIPYVGKVPVEGVGVKRPEIDIKKLSVIYGEVLRLVDKRLQEKGNGIYASNHEALGIITEEYWELIEAVKDNDNYGIREELKDIAVGCLIALASKKES